MGGASAWGADWCISPLTIIDSPHFLQRILKTFPFTFSSEIEYLAEQFSQTIFISDNLESRT
jgi:hypothetical protein